MPVEIQTWVDEREEKLPGWTRRILDNLRTQAKQLAQAGSAQFTEEETLRILRAFGGMHYAGGVLGLSTVTNVDDLIAVLGRVNERLAGLSQHQQQQEAQLNEYAAGLAGLRRFLDLVPPAKDAGG